MIEEKDFYSTTEAQELLGICQKTMHTWIKNKKIHAEYNKVRNRWRIPHIEIVRINEGWSVENGQ